jgi:hypothetical protein
MTWSSRDRGVSMGSATLPGHQANHRARDAARIAAQTTTTHHAAVPMGSGVVKNPEVDCANGGRRDVIAPTLDGPFFSGGRYARRPNHSPTRRNAMNHEPVGETGPASDAMSAAADTLAGAVVAFVKTWLAGNEHRDEVLALYREKAFAFRLVFDERERQVVVAAAMPDPSKTEVLFTMRLETLGEQWADATLH